MTPAQQAELEQVARALRHELTQQDRDRDWDCCLSNEQASVGIIVKALASQRATVLEEVRQKFFDNSMTDAQFAEWLFTQAQEQRP